MNKLQAIKEEFDDHKEKLINQSEEMIKKSIEEMENVEITPEQQEILEELQNKSGIEIDGSDIGEILDDLAKSFDIKQMAAPYQQIMKGAEETAVTAFIALYELDEEEYSEERVLSILKDTLDFFIVRYTIDITDGLNEAAMQKILKHPVPLSELPHDFRTIVFGEATTIISIDKYQRKMTEALLPLAQLSMKESIDAYIDRQAIEMELFASQEKLLADTKKRMKEDKTIALDIMKNIVEEVKKSQPNLKVLNNTNTIKINYFKNIKALRIMAELCEQAETDNVELKDRMIKQGAVYKEKAEMLERIINLEFTQPLSVYHQSFKGDKDRMEKSLIIQLENFIQRVSKYKFSVPMPGYTEADKTYKDVIDSMKKYYSNVLEEYYKQRETLLEENPDLDLPIYRDSYENGKYVNDFGGSSFTMIVLLTLARFDKKHLKHVDFDLEKNKVMEYYLVYELYSSLHKDVFTLAELIKFANSLV